MKILFITSVFESSSSGKPIRSWLDIPFGISYLSSVLKAHGFTTELQVLFSFDIPKSKRLANKIVESYNPDVICFSAVFSEYCFIKEIAAYLKKSFSRPFFVIGGVHATLCPEEVIKGPFDALCVGEGEFALLELCQQLMINNKAKGIANLWIKMTGGCINKTSPREFLKDLDAIPFPDRNLWERFIRIQKDDEMRVLLGRGCFHSCSFCSNSALKNQSPGNFVRTRSPKAIVSEIASLYKEFPLHKRYMLEISSIVEHKAWLFELCEHLKKFNKTIDDNISYTTNVRLSKNCDDESMFKVLRQSNIKRVNIGLESGSERIRRDILNRKHCSNEEFIKRIEMVQKNDIEICLNNMIGLPTETFAEHKETINMNRKIQPFRHSTSIFFPYPGTELFEKYRSEILPSCLKCSSMFPERYHSCFDSKSFTKKQIERSQVWFEYKIYKGHKSLFAVLIWTIRMYIRTNTGLGQIYLKSLKWPVLDKLRACLYRRHK